MAIGLDGVVGRSLEADLYVEDPTVSRWHARIGRRGDTFRILDLASRNGTWVNGRRVHAAHLEHGDEIRLGNVRLVFVQW